MDLNRNLTKPADPILAPENAVMEGWMEEIITQGLKPDLAIDFHNDSNGSLFFSSGGKKRKGYLKNMKTLEGLLRKYTWFTGGTSFYGTTSFEEGLMSRYNIEALVYELNAHWIDSLGKKPLSEDWVLLGEQLCRVFYEYYRDVNSENEGE